MYTKIYTYTQYAWHTAEAYIFDQVMDVISQSPVKKSGLPNSASQFDLWITHHSYTV